QCSVPRPHVCAISDPAHPPSIAYSRFRQPPPPRISLFPYTTLFRSHEIFRQIGAGVLQEVLQVGCLVMGINGGLVRPIFNDHKLDRKSTRLNSSHVSTSYAVFCLKKKNTTELLSLATSRA